MHRMEGQNRSVGGWRVGGWGAHRVTHTVAADAVMMRARECRLTHNAKFTHIQNCVEPDVLHSTDYELYGVLRCDVTQSGESSTFRRNISPPF
jgi:hypothetical protein